MTDTNPGTLGLTGKKSEISFRGVKVPEGSLLYATFEKLARLPESELAKVGSVIDLFYGHEAQTERMAMLHERLERLEKTLGVPEAPLTARAAETEAPARKRTRKKPGKKKEPTEATKAMVKEMEGPEETVEQRQARMAKMEKHERMKDAALKKQWEKQKEADKDKVEAAPAKTPAQEEARPEAKKKPRRRRKPAKKETTEKAEE